MENRDPWNGSEKYLELFINNPMPMWIYDRETKAFLEVNEEAIRHYGYSRQEFLSMTINDIRPAEDIPRLDNLKRIKTEYSSIYSGVWRHYKKNGDLMHVEVTSHLLQYKGREASLVLINDITEKIKAEERREFERRDKEALINNTRDMIWSVSPELTLIAANTSFLDNLKRATGKDYKSGDKLLTPPLPDELIDFWTGIYLQVLKGEGFEKEVWIPEMMDLKGRWMDIRVWPIRDNEQITGLACYARDITERKRYEQDLREAQENLRHAEVRKQKEITEAVITAQENERQEIGRELHDNINQMLASARMYLSLLEETTVDDLPVVSKVDELLGSAIAEIRGLSHTLIAPSLGKTKLREAVSLLLDSVNQTRNINVHKEFSNLDENDVPDKLKLSIYRIVQEQINNIQKYARAKNITLKLIQKDDKIMLSIEDDGVGFDVKKQYKGVGLTNIRTRASLFKGQMKIFSSSGAGCKLTVTFPLEALDGV